MKSYRRHMLAAAATAMLCTPLAAQEGHQHGDQPKMTPEQQAMMEAYQKAGTPGAPHQSLAAMAGSYDVKVKAGTSPASRRKSRRAPPRAR